MVNDSVQAAFLCKLPANAGSLHFRKTIHTAPSSLMNDIRIDPGGRMFGLATLYFPDEIETRITRINPSNGQFIWNKKISFRADSCQFSKLIVDQSDRFYAVGDKKSGAYFAKGFALRMKKNGQTDGQLPAPDSAAFQRVHDIFEGQSVNNVVWVWCPNNGSSPSEPWNVPEAYYPGDSYVDWIGFDGYNFGTSQTWSGWQSFFNIYNALYQKFKTYGKPIMLGEFASVEQGGSKSQWIADAYSTWIKFGYTQIKAATWFHIAKTEGTVFTDWRINSSPTSLLAYQTAIADPYFLASIPPTDVEDEKVIPEYFALEQNYPNPFNPSTKIKFALPSSGDTKLIVYNIFGEKVKTLVQSYLEAGNHEIDFTAEDLSSGVYLYALQFDGKQEIKKMILQK